MSDSEAAEVELDSMRSKVDDLLPEGVEDPLRVYYYSVIVNGEDYDPEVRVKRNYY